MDLTSSFNSLTVGHLPSTVNNFAAAIRGIHTEFVFVSFPNYINLLVTQFGKIGNLYQVKIDQPENGYQITEPVYSINTLLGGENLEAEVAARYLTEKLKIKKPVLLCLSLKNYSRTTVDIIAKVIIENYRKI